MSKTIKVEKGGYIYVDAFSDWFDVSLVKYYSLKKRKNGSLVLKFYDKKKKVLKPCQTPNT